jgi:threonine dehydrogenase-like Zn-dependent dehydrogenase
MVGKHREKLSFAKAVGVSVVPLEEFKRGAYDLVIEATGNRNALEMAIENTKPRGIVVLKSTYAGDISFNPSKVVVDEISIIGSRCGRFEVAINFLSNFNNRLPLSQLISKTFPLEQAIEAFEYAQNPEILKTIIEVDRAV